MTALATIADQSTVADGVRGWLFVVAVIVIGGAVLTVIACRRGLGNVPVMGDEPSTLDRLDRPHCSVPFCDDPVQVHIRAGHDTWIFCLDHGTPYLTPEVAE